MPSGASAATPASGRPDRWKQHGPAHRRRPGTGTRRLNRLIAARPVSWVGMAWTAPTSRLEPCSPEPSSPERLTRRAVDSSLDLLEASSLWLPKLGIQLYVAMARLDVLLTHDGDLLVLIRSGRTEEGEGADAAFSSAQASRRSNSIHAAARRSATKPANTAPPSHRLSSVAPS